MAVSIIGWTRACLFSPRRYPADRGRRCSVPREPRSLVGTQFGTRFREYTNSVGEGYRQGIGYTGGCSRTRTCDPLIKSQLLHFGIRDAPTHLLRDTVAISPRRPPPSTVRLAFAGLSHTSSGILITVPRSSAPCCPGQRSSVKKRHARERGAWSPICGTVDLILGFSGGPHT